MPVIARRNFSFPTGAIDLDNVYGTDIVARLPVLVQAVEAATNELYKDITPLLRAAKAKLDIPALTTDYQEPTGFNLYGALTSLFNGSGELFDTGEILERIIQHPRDHRYVNGAEFERQREAAAPELQIVATRLRSYSRQLEQLTHIPNAVYAFNKAITDFLVPEAAVPVVLPSEHTKFSDALLLKSTQLSVKDYERNLTLAAPTAQEFLHEESIHRGLLLRELDSMLAQAGMPAGSVLQTRVPSPDGNMGSQPLLFIADMTLAKRQDFDTDVKNETTTRFRSYNDFASRTLPAKAGDTGAEVTVAAPSFALDADAIAILRAHKAGEETLRGWAGNYMRAAMQAEHDYLHKLILPQLVSTPEVFSDLVKDMAPEAAPGFSPPSPPPGDYHAEMHALSTHAQLMGRIFARSPERKRAVLNRAEEAFRQLGEIQHSALAHCCSGKERRSVNEAVTYLAELYAHRLFRFIAPEDPALGAGVAAADKLILISPDGLQAECNGKPALARLRLHAAKALQFDYGAIHAMREFPTVSLADIRRANATPSQPVRNWKMQDTLPFFDQAFAAFAEGQPDKEALSLEAQARAALHRDAARHRLQGDGKDKAIEAELRRPQRGFTQRLTGNDTAGSNGPER